MIRLGMTLPEMRAEIGASSPPGVQVLNDPLAPAFVEAPAIRLETSGQARDDLLPVLKVPLVARFSSVPPARLTRDLLAPIKNGLGNAHKRGNQGDRSKSIHVAIDVTPYGAVVALTDEGTGFDVENTLNRFRNQQHYFHNYGAGFRIFESAFSLVSYANGGRTFLLCFRVDGNAASPPSSVSSVTSTANDRESSLRRVDEGLGKRLRDALVQLGPGLTTRGDGRAPTLVANGEGLVIDALRVFRSARRQSPLRCAIRCRLDGRLVTAFLTGRRFDSPRAALSDFENSRMIRARVASKKVRIPEPIVCLEDDGLVFSAFDPWMDLWTYVAQRGEPRALVRLADRLGTFLRTMHRVVEPAPTGTNTEEWPAVLHRSKRFGESAVRVVGDTIPERQDEVSDYVGAFLRWASRPSSTPQVLIHGEFGADSIHYGVDGRFYLWGFTATRVSHPGLDVGHVVADLHLLERSCANGSPRSAGAAVGDAFMNSYAGDDQLAWRRDVRHFALGALLQRLARTPTTGSRQVGELLDSCGRVLGATP